jgi:hypothetical protein
MTRALALTLLVLLAIALYRKPAREPAAPAKSDLGASPEVAQLDGAGRSPIPNAQMTYKSIEPQIRACFAAQQIRSPSGHGKAVFGVDVGPRGEVTGVSLVGDSTFDDPCIECMIDALRVLRFDPPLDGHPVRIEVPIGLTASPPRQELRYGGEGGLGGQSGGR